MTAELYDEPAELLDHLAKLRELLRDAENTRQLILIGDAEPADGWGSLLETWRAGLHHGIELRLAGERVAWWQQLVTACELRCRELGLLS